MILLQFYNHKCKLVYHKNKPVHPKVEYFIIQIMYDQSNIGEEKAVGHNIDIKIGLFLVKDN